MIASDRSLLYKELGVYAESSICPASIDALVEICGHRSMEAFVRMIPLHSAATPCCWLPSNDQLPRFPTTTSRTAGFVRFHNSRISNNSLNGSASHSSQEDGPDSEPIPPIPNQDTTQNGGQKERYLNGEKSAKSDGLPTTPSVLPAKEVLHRLRREAQLKSIIEELKYNSAVKPSPSQQPCADLEVQEREVRVPSWAVTALTMAVAFSAGVALAQFRGGLFSRNKPAVVDSRVAPSGTASVSYSEQLLGHFRAEEAPESDIKAVLADGSVRLRTAAADAFCRMQDAARAEGIWLIPLSGFRSVRLQQELFFDIKAECRQSATERAKISAPPGYSEHHTGYALDIGDASDPKTYFEQEFEEGAAYRWLQQNAARFHFELSFPKGNSQGVMYEPWHWRFVGDDHSLHTFYAQHRFSNPFPSCKP